jgi:hypothetical protein
MAFQRLSRIKHEKQTRRPFVEGSAAESFCSTNEPKANTHADHVVLSDLSGGAAQRLDHRDAEALARHSRNQIGKQGLTTENAEFAEIFYFKVSFSESSPSQPYKLWLIRPLADPR